MLVRELPARPNLEQYKKQARDLVRDRANDLPEAFVRIRHFHPRWRGLPDVNIQRASFKLSDAQLIIAREHAFESWPRFARHVANLQPVRPVPSLELFARPGRSAQRIRFDGIDLSAEIAVPEDARGLVLFTNASGSSRHNPRNRFVADLLNRGALCTVQADLLTEEEELADIETEEVQFDIRLLGRRIAAIADWIGGHSTLKGLQLGYLGSGTGAAAALLAAAEGPSRVQAVVSMGGRPDLAGPWLWRVQAPTLLLVGSKDTLDLAFNHSAMKWFPHPDVCSFEVINGASRLFAEPGALEKSAASACDWFRHHLKA